MASSAPKGYGRAILAFMTKADEPCTAIDVSIGLGVELKAIRGSLVLMLKSGKVHVVKTRHGRGGETNLYAPGPKPDVVVVGSPEEALAAMQAAARASGTLFTNSTTTKRSRNA